MKNARMVAVVGAALALLVGCGTTDLRPDAWANPTGEPAASAQERGRALLEELAQAHGGVDAWKAGTHTQFVVRDRWPNPITRAAACPWPEAGQRIRFTILSGQDSIRAEFVDGPEKGTAWGIQQWVTYTVPDGQTSPRFEPDSDIWFWLPTIVYFFEAPFRLREGQNVAYLGSEKLGDRTYEKVFVTWGGWQVSGEIDQYVVWMDAQTRRLAYLEYTVRDFGASMKGTVAYSKYTDVGGLLAPGDVRTVDGPGSSEVGLHQMVFTEVDYAADVPRAFVVPDPSRSAGKGDEGEAR